MWLAVSRSPLLGPGGAVGVSLRGRPGLLQALAVQLPGLLRDGRVERRADAVHPTGQHLLVGGRTEAGRVHLLVAVEQRLDLLGHHDGRHGLAAGPPRPPHVLLEGFSADVPGGLRGLRGLRC